VAAAAPAGVQQAAWDRNMRRLGRQALPCLLMGLVAGSRQALWQQQWH
jgi:hypothetical protein